MKASVISRRQRWMLPRTAFVLIVIGIAYIKYPDISYNTKSSSINHQTNSHHSSGSGENLIQFSFSRHLLQSEEDPENLNDAVLSSQQSPTVTDSDDTIPT